MKTMGLGNTRPEVINPRSPANQSALAANHNNQLDKSRKL